MSGSFNKLLEIDLSAGTTRVRDIDPTDSRAFVGGSALAARLFLETPGPRVEPLSPDSPLFIMTGPLVGTTFPGTSRFVLCARSPLTGIWGESSSGGAFGAEFKKTGVDGALIIGRADQPSYVLIENSKVSVVDADHLWGRDTYDTVDALRKKHSGGRGVKVLAIGPAGENLVKFASVINDKAHHFGRTGMGAVMGSKNLKAIVVRGTGKPRIADEQTYRTVRKAAVTTVKESLLCQSSQEVGTAAAMDVGMLLGDVPIKNWSVGSADDMCEALGGPALAENLVTKRKACFACPIGCKPVVEVSDTKYEVPEGPGPEYETCAAFGTMIMNDNLSAVAKANDICNRLGLDTITCGATIAFIMEASERGLFSKDDLDGIDMSWGNVDGAIEMISRIAARDGFGDRAAEGSRALAQSLGEQAEEFLVEIKGLELPLHDPRAFHGIGLAYMNSNRGACHLQHSDLPVEQGAVSWPELGLEEEYDPQESEGKAEMVHITENLGQMGNAVCMCHFVHWAMGNQHMLDGFNAVTGYGFNMEQFLEVGQRSWVLKRALNNIMGVTAADDRLPKRVCIPLDDGGASDSVPDEALMKEQYYAVRGLDDKGYPTPELLKSLGLEFVESKLPG